MIARCAGGSVEYEAAGNPILGVACYCDDCQEGARRVEALPGAPPVRDPDAAAIPRDVPAYPGFSARFIWKLLGARLAMALGR